MQYQIDQLKDRLDELSDIKVETVTYTKIFTSSGTWTNSEAGEATVTVRLFGGGGGANESGGGGGNMATGTYKIASSQSVPVTIGLGGGSGQNGGTTSFGTYLSANGGTAGVAATTSSEGSGGSGGSGGGGGRYWVNFNEKKTYACNGGKGSYGGGGGGGNGSANGDKPCYGRNGGSGGTYGGGGGGGGMGYLWELDLLSNYTVTSNGGSGGTYGGSGGAGGGFNSATTEITNPPSNGVKGYNTNSLDVEYKGSGLAGAAGANGDRPPNVSARSYPRATGGGGGGGGYGGNGGKGGNAIYKNGTERYYNMGGGGGGGGGYGAQGGAAGYGIVNADIDTEDVNTGPSDATDFGGGGGGGYGGRGGDAGYSGQGYGAGGGQIGGGGGGYGLTPAPTKGQTNGNNGICIVTWTVRKISI